MTLDPLAVAARLAELRRLYVPETIEEARRRLASERPRSSEPFAAAVGRRLGELRALDDLARHLHRDRPESPLTTSSTSPRAAK